MKPILEADRDFRSIFKPLSLIAAILFLSACASQQEIAKNTEVEVLNESATDSETLGPNSIESVAERPLDAETMALLLEAERAAYRKDFDVALAIYSEQADLTRDPGIARRYAEVSAVAEDLLALLDASLLWYELAPEQPSAQNLAIRALAKTSETEGAWEIITRHPDNHFGVRLLAAETRQAEYNAQLIWLYEQVIDTYGTRPNSSELMMALSIMSEGIGIQDAAVGYSAGAAALDPDALLPMQLYVGALIRSEQANEAVAAMAAYSMRPTAASDDRIHMAQQLGGFSKEAALPIYKALSEEFPQNTDLLISTAQLLMGMERTEEAEIYYSKLTRYGEYRDLAHFNLGRIYEYRRVPDQARHYYLLVPPGDMEFEARLRAALLQDRVVTWKANKEFKTLREDFPENAIAIYHEQGRAHMNAKRPDSAVTIYTMGLEEFPANQTLLYARSVAFESTDKIDEAVQDLRTILEGDEDNISALNALGYTLANRTDQYEEAYELIDRALALDPEDPAIIDSMGWVLYRLGRHAEALEYLARAYEAFFDEEVISHLVQVLLALDRTEEAKTILDDGVTRLPRSEMLRELRSRL